MSRSVKKIVRKRDKQKCCDCGMTAAEHKRRFRRTLHVHRTKSGPYRVETSVTLCQRCHQSRHSVKCAIRKRDGYRCTECGMSNDEHLKLYFRHLEVHSDRGEKCSEWEFGGLKVSNIECSTLCVFCHLAKHSIEPAVLKRDQFRCQDCGKKPENVRLWFHTLGIHKLQGFCDGEVGKCNDLAAFITLCGACHEQKHPDRFAEYLGMGFEPQLPSIVQQRPKDFGIEGPIASVHQFGLYKEYLHVVNFFVRHFQRNGVPNKSQLRASITNLPDATLSAYLRKKAAKEAVEIFNVRLLTAKEEKKQIRMSASERESHLQEKKDRYLDRVLMSNDKPSLSFWTGERCYSIQI